MIIIVLYDYTTYILFKKYIKCLVLTKYSTNDRILTVSVLITTVNHMNGIFFRIHTILIYGVLQRTPAENSTGI